MNYSLIIDSLRSLADKSSGENVTLKWPHSCVFSCLDILWCPKHAGSERISSRNIGNKKINNRSAKKWTNQVQAINGKIQRNFQSRNRTTELKPRERGVKIWVWMCTGYSESFLFFSSVRGSKSVNCFDNKNMYQIKHDIRLIREKKSHLFAAVNFQLSKFNTCPKTKNFLLYWRGFEDEKLHKKLGFLKKCPHAKNVCRKKVGSLQAMKVNWANVMFFDEMRNNKSWKLCDSKMSIILCCP